MQAGGWIGDLGRRVDGVLISLLEFLGNDKRHTCGVLFGWWYQLWCGTISRFVYPHLAHLFLCIGPQPSLPHSIFVDLLICVVSFFFIVLVSFLFVQRVFMCVRWRCKGCDRFGATTTNPLHDDCLYKLASWLILARKKTGKSLGVTPHAISRVPYSVRLPSYLRSGRSCSPRNRPCNTHLAIWHGA